MKLSLLLNVYNEADILEYLDVVLRYVDQAIITEGSSIGISNDGSGDMLREYQKKYPHLMLFHGEYVREDGGWAQAVSKNLMLLEVTGDYIMLHHTDLIYDEGDMIKLREAIDKFPQKAVYYTPMREFFYDMQHIRLYHWPLEGMLPRPLIGDVPAFAVRTDPIYYDPNIALSLREWRDIHEGLFLPDVRRWHLGFVRPFPRSVEKRLNDIANRDWGNSNEIINKGFEAMFQAAVDHVESYKTDGSMFDYCGDYPLTLQGRRFAVTDDREKFYDEIERYKERFYLYYERCLEKKNENIG